MLPVGVYNSMIIQPAFRQWQLSPSDDNALHFVGFIFFCTD
jgi:hypothetical protein